VKDSFSPLRQPNFRWYFLATSINLMGGTMASVALAFAVLDISDSPSALGQVLAANSIPLVVFLLLGGVIADRIDRARLIQAGMLLAGLSQAAVATLVITDAAEIWHLIVLGAVNGVVFAASFPAQQALVPELVEPEDLQSANVLRSMVRGALTVMGPTLAALLVVTVGAGWALAFDAGTWLAASAVMALVRVPPRPARSVGQTSTWTELREGWTVVVGHTWLWVVVLAFGFLNAIHTGAWFTLGPAQAEHTIGASGWGIALSAEAIGLLLCTLVTLRVRLERPLLTGMLGMSLLAAPIIALGSGAPLPVIALCALVAGAGTEMFSLGWNLAMQEHVPREVLSRAYSYDALGSFVAMPVGQLLFGPLGEHFGVGRVIVIGGVAYLAIVLLTLSSSSVRGLSRRTTSTPVLVSP
jgi:MFS family permease